MNDATQMIERSPRKHPDAVLRAKRTCKAFDQAIRAAVPAGNQTAILELFQNRVTWNAIKHWRSGQRGVPQWAIDCVMARGRAIVDPLLQVAPSAGNMGKFNLPNLRAQKEKAAA